MSGDTFEDSLFGYGEEFSPFEEIPQATLGSSVPCSPSHTFSHRIASVDFDSLETLAKGQVFPPHQPSHHLPTQTKVEEINSLFDIDDQEEEGADADSGIWEKDLDRLINDFDSQNIPLDQTTIDELVAAPVKAFHQRIKAMKLEKPHIQYLKASRKRLKNREAAIRSRNKKENRVLELQNLIQELQSKNLALQRRVEELEARQPNPSA